MNLKWSNENIVNELKELKKEYNQTTNFYKKAEIAYMRQTYLSFFTNDENLFPLNEAQINKYYDYNQNEYDKQKEKICNIINDNKDKYFKLFNNISKTNSIIDTKILANKFIIDTKSIEYINDFTKQYDKNLNNHFNYIYDNNYIKIINKQNKDYRGYCICLYQNKKSYILVYTNKNNYILPTIVHELGHSYETTIQKKEKSWIKGINIYNEVFAILLTLLFSEYISQTDYYMQAIAEYKDFFTTNYNMSIDLKKTLKRKKEKNIDTINDFIYAYNSNIALAFLQQYNTNKKEGKQNIDYFLHNCDILYSDKLLNECDIDLKKLHSGEYYKEYYQKIKKLTK